MRYHYYKISLSPSTYIYLRVWKTFSSLKYFPRIVIFANSVENFVHCLFFSLAICEFWPFSHSWPPIGDHYKSAKQYCPHKPLFKTSDYVRFLPERKKVPRKNTQNVKNSFTGTKAARFEYGRTLFANFCFKKKITIHNFPIFVCFYSEHKTSGNNFYYEIVNSTNSIDVFSEHTLILKRRYLIRFRCVRVSAIWISTTLRICTRLWIIIKKNI